MSLLFWFFFASGVIVWACVALCAAWLIYDWYQMTPRY